LAKRPIIRHGDLTMHGGTVISADHTFAIYGKSVARVGDLVSCPRCKGIFPIVTGAPYMWSSQNIARQDDITSCGAKLIASQSTTTIDDDSEASESVAAAPAPICQPEASSPDEDQSYTIRFQALAPETGKPIPECIYILTRENGAQHGGMTDSEGYTEIIETSRPEQIGVHFMFKSPTGDNIDRKDLAI